MGLGRPIGKELQNVERLRALFGRSDKTYGQWKLLIKPLWRMWDVTKKILQANVRKWTVRWNSVAWHLLRLPRFNMWSLHHHVKPYLQSNLNQSVCMKQCIVTADVTNIAFSWSPGCNEGNFNAVSPLNDTRREYLRTQQGPGWFERERIAVRRNH